MLFSCPRCTGGAHLASQNRNLGSLPKMVDFLISGYCENAIFLSLLHLWPRFCLGEAINSPESVREDHQKVQNSTTVTRIVALACKNLVFYVVFGNNSPDLVREEPPKVENQSGRTTKRLRIRQLSRGSWPWHAKTSYFMWFSATTAQI